MKPSLAASLLALWLLPHAALAQDGGVNATAPSSAAPAPGSEAGAREEVSWSLGAGVGFEAFPLVIGSSSLASSIQLVPSTPGVRASLERSAGPGRWLVFGVAGAASRSRGDGPDGTFAVTRSDRSALAVAAGLRQRLSSERSPVCISALVLASAGYSWDRMDRAGTTPETLRSDSLTFGASVGLAVDRELTPGLSLRVATSLAGLWWDRSSSESELVGKATRSGVGLSLGLAPSLELRLAF